MIPFLVAHVSVNRVVRVVKTARNRDTARAYASTLPDRAVVLSSSQRRAMESDGWEFLAV